MASLPLVILLTAWAIFEIGIDKSTFIGNRTGLVGVIFRTVTSAFSGAVLSSSAGMGVGMGIIAGLLGGAIGTYGGYYLRRACVNNTSLGDFSIGIAEDLLAIGLGVLFVCLAAS